MDVIKVVLYSWAHASPNYLAMLDVFFSEEYKIHKDVKFPLPLKIDIIIREATLKNITFSKNS